MKKLFLMFLMLQVSQLNGQSIYDFKLCKSIEVGFNKFLCLNSNNCFYFKPDRNHLNVIMSFSNSGLKRNTLRIIDTIGFTDYTSTIHNFCSNKDIHEFVILCETEYENLSWISAYYLKGNQLFKIGIFYVALACKNCEYYGYPIRSIRIRKINDDIEFSFLEDLYYQLQISDTGGKFFKAETFKYLYNVNQKKLKVVTTGD